MLQKIGNFSLVRLLGEGGMASVYEGVNDFLGTRVAIKVLNPLLSSNSELRDRFKNEARLMATLNHENILQVKDFIELPGQLAIVMEYLEGEDLNQKIKREGPLKEIEIKRIFKQALFAIQHAHEKGIVHRDIKPSNIFILPDGNIKILDFGIAKLLSQANELTTTGSQMGTPVYMSPEQVRAEKNIDHRTDIYSLGVTLYFAICGKPPYDSITDSQFDILNKIVFSPLPPLSINSKFSKLIEKACHKNKDSRFQTCIEWSLSFDDESRLNVPPPLQIPPPLKVNGPNNNVDTKLDIEDSSTLKSNSELFRIANNSLKGNWTSIVFSNLGAMFIFSIARFVFSILYLLVMGTEMMGTSYYFLGLARNKEMKFGDFFYGYNVFSKSFKVFWLIFFRVFLRILLLIVPGIIEALSVSLTYFILIDNPSLAADDAIALSKKMMEGNKAQLFRLHLRFAGLCLLSILTCGIALLWLVPLFNMTFAKFYTNLKTVYERKDSADT